MKFKYTIDNSICTFCSGCSSVCPVRAIKIKDNSAEITDSCIGCDRCNKFCPVSAISKCEAAK